MEPGKRHALRTHMPEAATEWLNPLSLGTMSASALKSFLFEMVLVDKL